MKFSPEKRYNKLYLSILMGSCGIILLALQSYLSAIWIVLSNALLYAGIISLLFFARDWRRSQFISENKGTIIQKGDWEPTPISQRKTWVIVLSIAILAIVFTLSFAGLNSYYRQVLYWNPEIHALEESVTFVWDYYPFEYFMAWCIVWNVPLYYLMVVLICSAIIFGLFITLFDPYLGLLFFELVGELFGSGGKIPSSKSPSARSSRLDAGNQKPYFAYTILFVGIALLASTIFFQMNSILPIFLEDKFISFILVLNVFVILAAIFGRARGNASEKVKEAMVIVLLGLLIIPLAVILGKGFLAPPTLIALYGADKAQLYYATYFLELAISELLILGGIYFTIPKPEKSTEESDGWRPKPLFYVIIIAIAVVVILLKVFNVF